MKKSIVSAVLGFVAASFAYGQAGYIFFGNYWSSRQSNGIYYGAGPYAGWGVGNEISAELFYGPNTATSICQLTALPGSITQVGWNNVTTPAPLNTAFGNFPGAGVFSHGPVQIPLTPGGTYAFAIYAFGTVQGVFCDGWSPIETGITQATPASAIPFLPEGLYKGSFAVGVPEPATMVSGGLGLASLLVFRRKNS